MFQRFRQSRSKGLLSDAIARWLLIGQALLVAAVTVTTFSRMDSFDGALPLRFATSEGYYDEGAWYRPLLLVLFAAVVSVTTIALSSSLYAQKDRELSRGIIVCSLVVLLKTLQIALNFIIPGQV